MRGKLTKQNLRCSSHSYTGGEVLAYRRLSPTMLTCFLSLALFSNAQQRLLNVCGPVFSPEFGVFIVLVRNQGERAEWSTAIILPLEILSFRPLFMDENCLHSRGTQIHLQLQHLLHHV